MLVIIPIKLNVTMSDTSPVPIVVSAVIVKEYVVPDRNNESV